MSEKQDFTLHELFEEAKQDSSWEADPEMRKKLVDGLCRSFFSSLS